MKTVMVIFTNEKKEDTSQSKRYSFNTTDEVKIGDLLTDPSYSTKLQVVEIKEQAFKNVNVKTGELTNEEVAYPIYPIKQLPPQNVEVEETPQAEENPQAE